MRFFFPRLPQTNFAQFKEVTSSLEKYLNNNSNGENTIIGMVIVLIRIVINVLCATTG